MLKISEEEISVRLSHDNKWWQEGEEIIYQNYPRRGYFDKFYSLATQKDPRRAVLLMGPRRVGKTVLIYQAIGKLIQQSVPAKNILYVSVDTPTYVGLSLEQFIKLFISYNGHNQKDALFIFFDEIQYLKNWELHLKDAVDSYPNIKFVASGSAAAALKMKSRESGAGRFTEFMLPPLTFSEYVYFSSQKNLVREHVTDPRNDKATDIQALNKCFIEYLNYGGYPEVVINSDARKNISRYVKHDIIDKVLLRDLPSLYGINDIQELNRLFVVLAYNTGREVNLDGLASDSGVAKQTLKKYLEYLEAAFLIVRVRKIDDTGRHFRRERGFKVYLTNPSMRAALFNPVTDDDPAMGALAETAIFSQWFHSREMEHIRYARWAKGEVDIVGLAPHNLKPQWAYEIKWSDRYVGHINELKGLLQFAKSNKLKHIGITTKTLSDERTQDDIRLSFFPASLHCYAIARRVLLQRD